ncbi:MAG: hypothetical protein HYU41_25290 [Candidatus Rokubacteria bacterium]|nr:hypothetical protein [Candidatus Rokubacteria bacterium]
MLCYKGSLDQYTNQVSLLDVIEGIVLQTETPPAVRAVIGFHVPMSLVTLWQRADIEKPETFTMRMMTITPNGEEVANKNELTCDLSEKRRLRTFLHIGGLPFQGPGMYRLAVDYKNADTDWQRVASVPFDVTVKTPERAAPTPSAAKADRTTPTSRRARRVKAAKRTVN